jgi:RNA polymerase sigma-70 factor (ECF subfamily)
LPRRLAALHLSTPFRRLNPVLAACQPLWNTTFSDARIPVAGPKRAEAFTPAAGHRSMTPTQENDRQIDAQLLARIAAGDEAAFGALYDRFSTGLFSFVIKMTRDEKEAEDVLQEGFAHIWRRAATYDPARSSPFTWAVMIFRNKAIDRLRVRQRLDRTIEKATVEFSHFPEADEAAAGEAERRDQGAQVRSALTQIPAEQKQAVELAFFSGLTHEQIAEKIGAPLGTVKARIRRGLLKLRDFLKEEA